MRFSLVLFCTVSLMACAGGDSSIWDGRWALGDDRLVIKAGETLDKKTAYFVKNGDISASCTIDDPTRKEVVLTCLDDSDEESYKLTNNGTSISLVADDKTFSLEKLIPTGWAHGVLSRRQEERQQRRFLGSV